MLKDKIKEIVIVCNNYQTIGSKYRLYNKDLGIYISGYNNKQIAIKHANKENLRMHKCLMVIKSWNN